MILSKRIRRAGPLVDCLRGYSPVTRPSNSQKEYPRLHEYPFRCGKRAASINSILRQPRRGASLRDSASQFVVRLDGTLVRACALSGVSLKSGPSRKAQTDRDRKALKRRRPTGVVAKERWFTLLLLRTPSQG